MDGRPVATPRAQPAPTVRDVERRVTVQMELHATDFQVGILTVHSHHNQTTNINKNIGIKRRRFLSIFVK